MEKRKLTPEIAEKFAKQKFKEIKPWDESEFNFLHAEAVLRTALLLSEGKNLDLDLITMGSWLHDIGKSISQENHTELGVRILEEENFEISDKLKDCILNHGTDGKPVCEEARMIKIADKASIIDGDMMKLLKKDTLNRAKEERKEDLEFIRKLANGAADLLADY